MDSADSMEKRGSQFSLIDSPELIKEYTKFAGENIGDEFGKAINNAADFWDLVAKESALLKSASETKVESSIEDLFDYSKEEQELDNFVKSAFSKELESVKTAHTNKKENFVDTYLETKATLENLNDYIESLNFKRASIIESVKKILRGSDEELTKFASYENDAKLLDSDVASILDTFVNEVAYKNAYITDNIKRASAEPKKHLIKSVHPITQAIIDYSDTLKCLKVASMTKEAMDWNIDPETGEILGVNVSKTPKAGTPILGIGENGSAEFIGEIGKNGENVFYKDIKFDQSGIDNLSDKAKKEKNSEKKDNEPKKSDEVSQAGNGFDQKAIDTLSSNTQKSDSSSSDASQDVKTPGKGKDYTNLSKAIVGAIDRVEDSVGKSITDIVDINKALFTKALGASSKEHSKLKPSSTKIYNAISDALFQKILMTDPILMKLDAAEIPNLVDAYKTYKQQYPEIAFQPALLKSILRSAAQVDGGEDISALKELTSARKNLAQSREIENK